MRALIVGAGSVGGYSGGRLAAAGRDVTFLSINRNPGRHRNGVPRIICDPAVAGCTYG